MSDYIIGRRPVLEALKSSQPIDTILILHGTVGGSLEQIKRLSQKQNIPVKETSREHLRELVGDTLTQGVIATISNYKYVEVDEILTIAKKRDEQPFILVLDEIEDPHNLGALIRTAECAGVHGIIIPKHHAASVNTTVAKVSAGATAHISIARVTNITQTLDELKASGVWITGIDLEGDRFYNEQDYSGALALVIGNEGRGLRHLVKQKCDFLVKIPMYGKIESLNASVAGALVMFEATKSRHFKK